MTIIVRKVSRIELTQEELERYRDEYNKAMQYYAGPAISFETWVKRQLAAKESHEQL